MDVVGGAGRNDSGDVEAEIAGPHLTRGAGWEGAIGSAGGAGDGLLEDLDAEEIAGEKNLRHGGAGCGGPRASGLELLGVVLLDGIGVGDA